MYVCVHNKMRQLCAKEEPAPVIRYKMTSLFEIRVRLTGF